MVLAAISLWLSSMKRENKTCPAELLQDQYEHVKTISSEQGKNLFIHTTNVNLAPAIGQTLFQATGIVCRRWHSRRWRVLFREARQGTGWW